MTNHVPQLNSGRQANAARVAARRWRSLIATRLLTLGALVVAAVSLLALAGAAPAAAEAPWWHVTSGAAPRNLPPGGEGNINVVATNIGDAEVPGASAPFTITDTLPSGLRATAISAWRDGNFMKAAEVTCEVSSVSCTVTGGLQVYEAVEVVIAVHVEPGASSGEENEATVLGGGIPSASAKQPITVNSQPSPFGVEDYELTPENEGGSLDTQAGSHPFQLTTTIALNRGPETLPLAAFDANGRSGPAPLALTKDLHFNIPPGLVGNPTPFPQCTDHAFAEIVEQDKTSEKGCPLDTVVGVARTTVFEPNSLGFLGQPVPLFNLVPNTGEPARFGFLVHNVPVILDTSVRTGGDYGVVVSVNNITETVNFLSSTVTFWGVPGDPRHNQSRGYDCVNGVENKNALHETCVPPPTEAHPAPLLTLPTSCTGPLRTSVEADSWAQEGVFSSLEPVFEESLDACNQLGFEPSISVAPDGQAGSTPTGLTVGIHVPQEISLNPTGLAEADVKNTTVALPAGVQLSPSAADGLQSCSDAQIGFTGVNPQSGVDEFTSGVPSCPDASKVATVKIKSPLLPNALEGEVYLAAPQNFSGPLLENPFGSLVAMYLVAQDPVSGVLVKLPGKVTPDPVTGQLVSTFENTPQLPFEDLELHFFGSARAPLSTPALCGTYTTQASIEPWSGNQAATPSSSFQITSGPNGGPCADPQPFSPGFNAETTNIQAGAFTPFQLTMTRPDADQTLSRIEMQMPPGLLGTLSNVKLCPEPQASQGTCGPESLIGETVVSVGLGNDPFTVTGGKVYITGSYKGAPYGLSIVNPAAAGPFVLDEGRPVVVRASIYVDPHTAALRIVSDPLPTILDGIPLQIQHVNVSIDREKFTFNPTNCGKLAVTGTLSSSGGASAAVSTPFQVTNCAGLVFNPKFVVSTSGKTSRAKGASLQVKLTYPLSPFDANIAKVKVDLPKQLPSRLTTLQKACTAATFEANPASCPKESVIGTAKATTPILPVPLEGPAYFVSHGGEAFPSLIIVLQGYGTTVDLVGTTFISKAGITSSTFKTVPDVPVGTFELTLPEGKYSALAANGNLCKSKLAMPTAFVAQNGAEIHESTTISVTGCSTGISIVSHKIKGRTLTVSVSVPAAGILTASGKGLSTSSKSAKGRETLTFKLTQKKPGKLSTKLKIAFKPSKGAKQAKSLSVKFKQ
jgi:hypothetical protein